MISLLKDLKSSQSDAYQKMISILYTNRTALKAMFWAELITGVVLLGLSIYFFSNNIYPGIWTFACPMLGLALFFSGLRSKKIKEISIDTTTNRVRILEESFKTTESSYIDCDNLKLSLKSLDNKKGSLTPKIKLLILDSDHEIAELRSDFLSSNNEKIEKLYRDLKSVVKAAEPNANHTKQGM